MLTITCLLVGRSYFCHTALLAKNTNLQLPAHYSVLPMHFPNFSPSPFPRSPLPLGSLTVPVNVVILNGQDEQCTSVLCCSKTVFPYMHNSGQEMRVEVPCHSMLTPFSSSPC